jgi:hypothetical protein
MGSKPQQVHRRRMVRFGLKDSPIDLFGQLDSAGPVVRKGDFEGLGDGRHGGTGDRGQGTGDRGQGTV